MKITILGAAGGIGQTLALLLTTNLQKNHKLSLYDISPVISGIAMDLSHIPAFTEINSFCNEEINLALSNTNIVLIVAGLPRKPGMTREDLFHVNADIIKKLTIKIAKYAPQACICIVTNPINSMVVIAANILIKMGIYNPKKLFGITTLDVIRANTFVAKIKNLPINQINVPVIGGHSSETILPLLSQVSGVKFNDKEIIQLTQRIRNAGTEIVEAKLGTGSATLAMGYAAMRFTISLIRALQGEKGIIECAYVKSNMISHQFFAQPVILGQNGIDEYKKLGILSSFETKTLEEIRDILNKDITRGEQYVQ